ncbi:acyl-CoA carboxylase subunit beta [Solirubrobacter taibaiensis]|nr:acyl-CoA carboxylase subunit beta [Solirubrobacter taibaiensis]
MSDAELLAALVCDAHVDAEAPPAPALARRSPSAEPARLRPLQRLQMLCDEGSLHVLRSGIMSGSMGEKARVGDGVVAASGRVGGRPIFCFAQDSAFAGGSLGAAHADSIVRVQRLARRARVPVIGFVESGGARMQEGTAALNGYGRIFYEHVAMSGDLPQISVITGTSAGGGCYSPALTDFVVMTGAAAMFLTGPSVVREVTGEDVTTADLGGPDVHARNGVCQFAVDTDLDAIQVVRRLLSYLPQSAGAPLPTTATSEPSGPDPGTCVPLDGRRVYDVREPLAGIVDADSILELAPQWAENLVTAFARIEGAPVGIVANQPRNMGGVIDAEASQKGARFVRLCNAFGIPLVVLVDTPGFLPGSSQERIGVIRHGAKLLHAFAEASVPRITVVLRKAFGGAYITMNSRDIGADLTLAWTRAEIGIMGAEQAVGVVHKRRLAEATDPADERRRLAEDYAARHLGAKAAARDGHIDEVILPGDTRPRLAAALAALPLDADRRTRVRNIPL